MTKPILYGIRNCDTVKRARAWLDAHRIEHEFHDYKKQGVPAERLRAWAHDKGWEMLLNRQGTAWRKLDEAIRQGVVDATSAVAVMTANASTIKRPVVVWSDDVSTVGFSEAEFDRAATAAAAGIAADADSAAAADADSAAAAAAAKAKAKANAASPPAPATSGAGPKGRT